MLRAIRNLFFKLRVFLGALRAGIYGIALVCAAWIFLLPASALEIERLGLQTDAAMGNAPLRTHRMAKLLVLIGSDRIYSLAASQSGSGLTADEIRTGVTLAAEAHPLTVDRTTEQGEAPDQSGAKFVSARQN